MLVDRRVADRCCRRVTLLGSFTATVHDGSGGDQTVTLGPDAVRLVAYLALHRRPQRPAALAADLWPGVPAAAAAPLLDEAAAAPRAAGLVLTDGGVTDGGVTDGGVTDGGVTDGVTLALAGDVAVDLDAALALVRRLTDGAGRPAGVPDDLAAATALLRHDVLPGESAAWLVVERERFRQIRLNALEELTGSLGAVGRHADAVALAEEIVRTAPSRESARRALIEAHLAQGGIAEAVAQYDEYQELLRSSVGAPGLEGAFGLEGLLPPVPAWPVLRVRRSMQRGGMVPPGVRIARGVPRRLAAGGSVPGAPR